MHHAIRKLFGIAIFVGLSNIQASTPPTPHAISSPRAMWTFMMYIQAKNNLAPFAEQNLRDIANAGSNPRVNIVAQWEKPRESEAWRYQISHKQVIAKSSTSTNPDPTTKLIDFAKWSLENYPADHYCLIIWNHGTGVIDPPFGSPLRLFFNKNTLDANPRIDLDGIFETVLDTTDQAVLINEENKTYMGNPDLGRAFRTITAPSMLGRKLDIIGFDACFMGMFEIAHEIRQYAHYMIASEELELARGWSYESFLPNLFSTLPSPEQLARSIVKTYGTYYRNRTTFYTQAAIDLTKLDAVKKSLDETIKQLAVAAQHFQPTIQLALQTARNATQQFSTRIYVDLHSFCTNLRDILANEATILTPTPEAPVRRREARPKSPPSPLITQIVQSLTTTINALESAIIENTSSPQLPGAHGLSIYFPCRPTKFIDFSYSHCLFNQESLWKSLIDGMLNN